MAHRPFTRLRYISLFSGIEAATVAWQPLGWEAVAFCEIDEFPSAVLRYHYPHVPNYGDITKVNWKKVAKKYGKPDVVVGGSPCQSFSIAGNRTGLDGASGLMWEYVRAVRELMPNWIIWENVPGALTSTDGADFRCLLEALVKVGYGVAWRVLDAQFFGVAQRRERVFLVGYLGNPERPAEVLFESEGLSWNTQSSKEKRKELTARATGEAGTCSSAILMRGREGKASIDNDLCGTIMAHAGKSQPYVSFAQNMRNEVRIQGDGTISGALAANEGMKQRTYIASESVLRRLMPIECERLQGFPDNWTRIPYRGKPAEECPDAPRYRAIGNSMAVPVMRWIGERIAAVEETTNA